MFNISADEPVGILIIIGFIAMVFVGPVLFFVHVGLFALVEIVGFICLIIGIICVIGDRM